MKLGKNSLKKKTPRIAQKAVSQRRRGKPFRLERRSASLVVVVVAAAIVACYGRERESLTERRRTRKVSQRGAPSRVFLFFFFPLALTSFNEICRYASLKCAYHPPSAAFDKFTMESTGVLFFFYTYWGGESMFSPKSIGYCVVDWQ